MKSPGRAQINEFACLKQNMAWCMHQTNSRSKRRLTY